MHIEDLEGDRAAGRDAAVALFGRIVPEIGLVVVSSGLAIGAGRDGVVDAHRTQPAAVGIRVRGPAYVGRLRKAVRRIQLARRAGPHRLDLLQHIAVVVGFSDRPLDVPEPPDLVRVHNMLAAVWPYSTVFAFA